MLKGMRKEYDVINSESRDFIMDNNLDYHFYTDNVKHNKITIQPHIFEQIPNIHLVKKVEENLILLILDTSESAEKGRGAKLLKDVLEESINRVILEVQKELEIEMNILAQKMSGVEFDISISESRMIFTNATGDVQDEGNESAELGAVYGLVSALNQYADVSLPIVVDTPLAGFGRGMAQAWVDTVVDSFDQGIALINSLEKDGIRAWWSQEDITCYTFLRENEQVRTGKDPDGGKTTGAMYIDPSNETFDLYEIDVGYEKKEVKK